MIDREDLINALAEMRAAVRGVETGLALEPRHEDGSLHVKPDHLLRLAEELRKVEKVFEKVVEQMPAVSVVPDRPQKIEAGDPKAWAETLSWSVQSMAHAIDPNYTFVTSEEDLRRYAAGMLQFLREEGVL